MFTPCQMTLQLKWVSKVFFTFSNKALLPEKKILNRKFNQQNKISEPNIMTARPSLLLSHKMRASKLISIRSASFQM